jgi:hypothetical protein
MSTQHIYYSILNKKHKKSYKGATGVIGPTGPAGIQGPTGVIYIGLTGKNGSTGPKGITGPSGIQGSTGATGISSTGPTGPTGSRGIQGNQGISGATGIIGQSGQSGLVYPNSNNLYISSISTTILSIKPSTTINSIIVASGYGNKGLLTSFDGGNSWNEPSSGFYYANYPMVDYGNNLFVAVGYDTDYRRAIQWSSNGIVWNYANTGGFFNNNGYYIKYINNRWIGFGTTNGPSYLGNLLSTDGSNWTNASSGGFSNVGSNHIAYGGSGILVAVGIGSNNSGSNALNSIQWSSDGGSNWNNALNVGFLGYKGSSVAWGNNVFVAVGRSSSSEGSILYSTNGSNWNTVISGGFYNGTGNFIVYANGLFVAVGNGSSAFNAVLYSKNGSNWSNANSGGFYAGQIGYSVAYGNGLWVATGIGRNESNSILYSPDGSNWTDADIGFTNSTGIYVKYVGNKWIASGGTNTILYSSNGSNWTTSVNGFTGLLTSVAYKSDFTPLINIGSNACISLSDNNITINNISSSVQFNNNLIGLVSTLSRANLNYLSNFTTINLTPRLLSTLIGKS